jgi:hypothetical protein
VSGVAARTCSLPPVVSVSMFVRSLPVQLVVKQGNFTPRGYEASSLPLVKLALRAYHFPLEKHR